MNQLGWFIVVVAVARVVVHRGRFTGIFSRLTVAVLSGTGSLWQACFAVSSGFGRRVRGGWRWGWQHSSLDGSSPLGLFLGGGKRENPFHGGPPWRLLLVVVGGGGY